MEKNNFLLDNKIEDIERSFCNSGWLTIFDYDDNDEVHSRIFCCLIDKNQKQDFIKGYSPPIWMGRERKSVVYGDNTYKTYGHNGLEPFLFYRNFPTLENRDSYIDVSEEFVLYWNLYEKGESKKDRKYCFIDDLGELIDVIVIKPDKVIVQLKYLKEYITIRDINFIVSYDFTCIVDEYPHEWNIVMKDEIKQTENYIFRHLIRNEFNYVQSSIMGNVFIDGNQNKSTHFDEVETKSLKFIVGYDDAGNEIKIEPSRSKEDFLKVIYFKRAVLEDYYNDPCCKVDILFLQTRHFTLKIDNDRYDCVPVFLGDLSYLPQKELYHWKKYNIPRSIEMGISRSYYECMIKGNFIDYPERVDNYFKHRYHEFNEKWEQKFGWKFYKPLADEDKFRFKILHLPATNNENAFHYQMLNLCIIIIDRLNENEIGKKLEKQPKRKTLDVFKGELLKKGIDIPQEIQILYKSERGLAKLERFITENGHNFSDMNEFHRRLWDLRSGLSAHGFSNSNDKCKKAIEYFGIKDNNYIEVARNIFEKAIEVVNILEKNFL